MGVPVELFLNQGVPDEFICSICHDVLEDPMMTSPCEHIYCKTCITTWNAKKKTCPIDRSKVRKLQPPQRNFVGLLNRLELTCSFVGCGTVCNLEGFKKHQDCCKHNPDKGRKRSKSTAPAVPGPPKRARRAVQRSDVSSDDDSSASDSDSDLSDSDSSSSTNATPASNSRTVRWVFNFGESDQDSSDDSVSDSSDSSESEEDSSDSESEQEDSNSDNQSSDDSSSSDSDSEEERVTYVRQRNRALPQPRFLARAGQAIQRGIRKFMY